MDFEVEEQLYLVYPRLFPLLPFRRFVVTVCILIALGPLARLLFSELLATLGRSQDNIAFGVYAASFCQFDAFLIGALIAVTGPKFVTKPHWMRRVALVAATVATIYAAAMIVANYRLSARGIDLIRRIYSGIIAGQGREVLADATVDLVAAAVLIAAVIRHPATRLLGIASLGLGWQGVLWRLPLSRAGSLVAKPFCVAARRRPVSLSTEAYAVPNRLGGDSSNRIGLVLLVRGTNHSLGPAATGLQLDRVAPSRATDTMLPARGGFRRQVFGRV